MNHKGTIRSSSNSASNSNVSSTVQPNIPSRTQTVVTPYSPHLGHVHANGGDVQVNDDDANDDNGDYDECSELIPRTLPLPMQQHAPDLDEMSNPHHDASQHHADEAIPTHRAGHHEHHQQQQGQNPFGRVDDFIAHLNGAIHNIEHEHDNHISQHGQDFVGLLNAMKECSTVTGIDGVSSAARSSLDSFLSVLSNALLANYHAPTDSNTESATHANDNDNDLAHKLHQENQQLRIILKDLGCASLIPPSSSAILIGDDESTHSSQLSQSFFQNLQTQRRNSNHESLHGRTSIHSHRLSQLHHPHTPMQQEQHLPPPIPMSVSSVLAPPPAHTHPRHPQHAHPINDPSQIISDLNMEREQLHQICQLKTDAISQMQRELHSAQLQHDATTHENSRLVSELVMLRQRIQEEQERSDGLQNEIRTLHNSKNELWKDLNRGMEEKGLLENECGRAMREVHAIKQDLQMKVEENGLLSENLKQLEHDLQCRLTQMASLEGEKDTIYRDLCSVKKALEDVKMERNRLSQDLNCSKMNGEMNSQKTLEIQQFAAKSHNDAIAYQSMVAELESERNSIQMMLNEERSKVEHLEEALHYSKASEIAASEQIRVLIREKTQVVTKLNEAHARLGCSSTERPRVPKSAIKRASSTLNALGREIIPLNSNMTSPSIRGMNHKQPSSEIKKKIPLQETGKRSIEQKQKEVELSLRELEKATPLTDRIIGQNLEVKYNQRTNHSPRGKENESPERIELNDTSFSLIGSLTAHDIKSPPSTKTQHSNSLLDLLSQDDASTLI